MSGSEKSLRVRRITAFAGRYLLFFLGMSFFVTCCMLLFLHNLSVDLAAVLPREGLKRAAKLTFGNILFLCFLYTAADAVWRIFTVERPVARILRAARKLTRGDFSVRIPPRRRDKDGFDAIIRCFNRMAEELSGMETLRTDFIANVSHELKTPLAVMQNYGTMLQQPELEKEKRLEYAKAITGASRSLAAMISNILKLNKLENQSIYPAVRAYDLGEQLCACLLAFEDAWEEKHLEIETALEENVLVETDPELLSLVWNNLFSNAVKFTEPGGKITLTLQTKGALAAVMVSDTGCGIRPEAGKRIFEKFYQGDTSHAAKGNGLGLALVKRVIDITGGDISVSSEVGKGSTFTVTLGRKTDATP